MQLKVYPRNLGCNFKVTNAIDQLILDFLLKISTISKSLQLRDEPVDVSQSLTFLLMTRLESL